MSPLTDTIASGGAWGSWKIRGGFQGGAGEVEDPDPRPSGKAAPNLMALTAASIDDGARKTVASVDNDALMLHCR